MKKGIYFVISAVIFFITEFSLASSECLNPPYSDCKVGENPYPVTTEEVEPFCSDAFVFLDCYRNNLVTCGADPAHVDRMISYYDEFCNNTLPLQQAALNSAVCVNITLTDRTCYNIEIEDDMVIKVNEVLQENGIPEAAYHENYTAMCTLKLVKFTCLSERIRANCGESAYYYVTKSYKSFWYPYDNCNEEIPNYFPQITKILLKFANELAKEIETKNVERLLTEENFDFENMAF